MKILDWNKNNITDIAKYLLEGGVVVLPTDTLYGLVARAEDSKAVERVYSLKSRNPEKKCIVLICGYEDLDLFGIKLTEKQRRFLQSHWPGKYSVELPCDSKKFEYLLRGTKTLSFRFPDDELLCDLLAQTGPLIAPSANPEGLEPAKNIEVAKEYFGEGEILYVDAKDKVSAPSTIVSLVGDMVEIIRS